MTFQTYEWLKFSLFGYFLVEHPKSGTSFLKRYYP